MGKKEIWIHPSDLSYCIRDTPVGFYDKYVLDLMKPRMDFPYIFKSIDEQMKELFSESYIDDIIPGGPHAILDSTNYEAKSSQFDLGDFKVGFSGYIDSFGHLDDGTIVLNDFKTTAYSENLKQMYFLQLMAYVFALQSPLKGNAQTVSRMGLIVWSPGAFLESGEGDVLLKPLDLTGKLRWMEIDIDKTAFKKWIVDDLKKMLHMNREDIKRSRKDSEWERYLNLFHVEEVTEQA